MADYRKKPVIIQAEQFTGYNFPEIARFTNGGFRLLETPYIDHGLWITAQVHDYLHDTWVGVHDGDWILRGTKGEHYPVAKDVFGDLYEPVPA